MTLPPLNTVQARMTMLQLIGTRPRVQQQDGLVRGGVCQSFPRKERGRRSIAGLLD